MSGFRVVAYRGQGCKFWAFEMVLLDSMTTNKGSNSQGIIRAFRVVCFGFTVAC